MPLPIPAAREADFPILSRVSCEKRSAAFLVYSLNRHVVAGALRRGAPAFVVDLRRGDVSMPEELWTLRISTPASSVAVVALRECGV